MRTLLKKPGASSVKKAYILIISLLLFFLPHPAAAQPPVTRYHDTGGYLTEEQSRLITPPSRYLFMPQLDLMIGAGRIYRGDKPRISYSIMHKGVYQATGILFFSIGGGYTRINSLTPRSGENSGGSARFADIIQAPVGLSIILGDDKAQLITGLKAMIRLSLLLGSTLFPRIMPIPPPLLHVSAGWWLA